MKLEEIRLIKQSEKSLVLLMRDEEDGKLYIKKRLFGQHEIYERLKSNPRPYFPKTYEVSFSDGYTTVIEEYIEGEMLAGAKLSKNAVLRVVNELCVTLSFLHTNGFVHRDINPYNIVMAKDGLIRLVDLDSVRTRKEDSEQDTNILGTKGYIPPEQYGFSQTDARADIYSLGVTFKELLGSNANEGYYKKIIKKCTEFNPDKRYKSVDKVRQEILCPNLKALKTKVFLVSICYFILTELVFNCTNKMSALSIPKVIKNLP